MYLDVICHIFGHRWDYYSNKRTCKRCNVEEEYHKVEIAKLGDESYRRTDVETKINIMYISRNFSVEELTKTSTGLPNKPNIEQLQNLTNLVNNILQPARNIYGRSITVTSGYRSPTVNKKVGGVRNSQHLKGQAADIICDNNKELFNIIKDTIKDYDQLIWEYGDKHQPKWIHVSWVGENNRRQIIYKYK